MLLGLVHTLKCLVLWFFISHFVLHFHWGYQRVMIYASILTKSSSRESQGAVLCFGIINVQGQKNYGFACKSKIKDSNSWLME